MPFLCDYLGFSFLDILCSHSLFLGIEKVVHIIAWEEIQRNILVNRLSTVLSTYLNNPLTNCVHTMPNACNPIDLGSPQRLRRYGLSLSRIKVYLAIRTITY